MKIRQTDTGLFVSVEGKTIKLEKWLSMPIDEQVTLFLDAHLANKEELLQALTQEQQKVFWQKLKLSIKNNNPFEEGRFLMFLASLTQEQQAHLWKDIEIYKQEALWQLLNKEQQKKLFEALLSYEQWELLTQANQEAVWQLLSKEQKAKLWLSLDSKQQATLWHLWTQEGK